VEWPITPAAAHPVVVKNSDDLAVSTADKRNGQEPIGPRAEQSSDASIT
jgi:hypothetical protein